MIAPEYAASGDSYDKSFVYRPDDTDPCIRPVGSAALSLGNTTKFWKDVYLQDTVNFRNTAKIQYNSTDKSIDFVF